MTKTAEKGIYLVGDIPSNQSIRDTYKFVIRQTITVAGVGKKTVKSTFEVMGKTYTKALETARDERPMMRHRAIDKIKGINTSEAKDNALAQLTLDQVWNNYVSHKTDELNVSKWSINNERTMKSTYKNHVQPYIGHMKALQVGYEDIERCLKTIRKRKLSARMEGGVIASLRPMFKWFYIRNKLIDSKTNPAKDQEIRQPKARQVHLTWKQMEKLFKTMYGYKDERFRQVWIWLSTGRRINEVLSLKHEHIEDGYYTINAENNKVRKPMMYKVPEGVTIPKYQGYIHSSPRNRDKPLTDVTVDKHWNILRSSIELPTFNKHDIRHLIETVLSDSDCPQRTIDLVLGHLPVGASKNYKNDTQATADLKAEAVGFFLDKVFNRIDRDLYWDLRNR